MDQINIAKHLPKEIFSDAFFISSCEINLLSLTRRNFSIALFGKPSKTSPLRTEKECEQILD